MPQLQLQYRVGKQCTGFPCILENPGFFFLKFQDLESPGNYLWFNLTNMPFMYRTPCVNKCMKYSSYVHRRGQDFVWGCTFSSKKLTTFFSRRPQNTRRAKKCPKIDSCCGRGCTSCPGGALTHFSCKLRQKKMFFTALGVQVHPLHPWLRLWLCANC